MRERERHTYTEREREPALRPGGPRDGAGAQAWGHRPLPAAPSPWWPWQLWPVWPVLCPRGSRVDTGGRGAPLMGKDTAWWKGMVVVGERWGRGSPWTRAPPSGCALGFPQATKVGKERGPTLPVPHVSPRVSQSCRESQLQSRALSSREGHLTRALTGLASCTRAELGHRASCACSSRDTELESCPATAWLW